MKLTPILIAAAALVITIHFASAQSRSENIVVLGASATVHAYEAFTPADPQ